MDTGSSRCDPNATPGIRAFLACLTLMVVRLSDDGMTEEQPAADTVEARESLLPTASNPGGSLRV